MGKIVGLLLPQEKNIDKKAKAEKPNEKPKGQPKEDALKKGD